MRRWRKLNRRKITVRRHAESTFKDSLRQQLIQPACLSKSWIFKCQVFGKLDMEAKAWQKCWGIKKESKDSLQESSNWSSKFNLCLSKVFLAVNFKISAMLSCLIVFCLFLNSIPNRKVVKTWLLFMYYLFYLKGKEKERDKRERFHLLVLSRKHLPYPVIQSERNQEPKSIRMFCLSDRELRPGKAKEAGPSLWALHLWESPKRLLAPSFRSAWVWLLRPFGKWTSRWKTSLPVFLLLCKIYNSN